MNADRIRKAVAEITFFATDPSLAHSLEDNLYAKFVGDIADHGPEDISRLAKEVLRTKDIDFPRWYE